MMRRSLFFGLAAMTSAMCAEIDAVNWGGKYLNVISLHDDNHGSNVLNLGEEVPLADGSGEGIGVRFGRIDTGPMSPIVDVYDNGGRSAIFYGLLEYHCAGVMVDTEKSIRSYTRVRSGQEEGGDYVQFRAARTEGREGRFVGLVYWRKDDFLGGLNGAKPISLISFSHLSASIAKRSKTGPGGIRFAVRNAGKWYLSSEKAPASAEFRLQIGSWGEWDPSTVPLPPPPERFDVSAGSLMDISAVGLFFDIGETWALSAFRAAVAD